MTDKIIKIKENLWVDIGQVVTCKLSISNLGNKADDWQ